VICHYERNQRTCDIVHATEVQESTLRNICNTAEEIKFSNASASSSSAKMPTTPEIVETMENLLSTWIQSQTKRKSCRSDNHQRKREKYL
jgi:hypothetical protein